MTGLVFLALVVSFALTTSATIRVGNTSDAVGMPDMAIAWVCQAVILVWALWPLWGK